MSSRIVAGIVGSRARRGRLRIIGDTYSTADVVVARDPIDPADRPQDNVQVCKNYRVQRAWVKSIAQPTVADGIKFETDLTVASAQATPSSPRR
jgi:hypothetical protein